MNVKLKPADTASQLAGPSDRWLTIPNALCAVRLVGAFVLPPLAIAGRPITFLITYLALTSTDWIDGKLARRLHQESKIGPKLDTVADVTMYGGLLFGLVWMYGLALAEESALIGAAIAMYAISCCVSLLKFRQLPAYHTRAAKVSWFLVLVAVVALFLDWSIWPLRVAMVAVALTNLEATMITCVSRQRQEDIASLWHAIHRPTSAP